MDEHDDLLRRLRSLGTQPVDPARQSADLTAMAMARPTPRIARKLRLAGAFLAGLMIGGTGLAAAEALPDPAQHVAHTVLGKVGVRVADPDRYHGVECGTEVKKNHGTYVRDDRSLAKSDCGKKLKAAEAGGTEGDGADGPATDGTAPEGSGNDGPGNGGPRGSKVDKGPCQGKPAWAGNTSLTPEQKAAARVAQCGADQDEGSTTTEAPTTTAG